MSTPKPKPLGASKAVVSRFAEQVAKDVGYVAGENMRAFVSRLGGRISYHEEIQPTDGFPESIVVDPSGEFKIFLPTVTTSERDRFTIAHELGHFFLHFPKIQLENPDSGMVATRRVNQTDEDQMRAEWEANWFAAAFLMPENVFREKWKTLSSSEQLATQFGVSQKAIDVRAKTLGL